MSWAHQRNSVNGQSAAVTGGLVLVVEDAFVVELLERETTEEGGEMRDEREHRELMFFGFSDSNTTLSSLAGFFWYPFFTLNGRVLCFFSLTNQNLFLVRKEGKKKRKRAPLCIHF